jgi:hypothetical protein
MLGHAAACLGEHAVGQPWVSVRRRSFGRRLDSGAVSTSFEIIGNRMAATSLTALAQELVVVRESKMHFTKCALNVARSRSPCAAIPEKAE